MRNLFIVLVLAISCFKLNAQNVNTREADKLFNEFEYVDAANAYLNLVNEGKGNEYIYKQLADSYYKVSNAVDAEKWYAKAVVKKQDAETYYRYAEMLKADGKYEEANKQMQQFAKMQPRDQRAVAFKQNPDYLPEINNIEKSFEVILLDINSDKSDFGAVLGNDNTLYFASARNTDRKIYGWNGEPFLDLYYAQYNTDGSFSQPIPIEQINSKYHEGPVTISSDGNTMYFASESFKQGMFSRNQTRRIKLGQIHLFKAVKINGKWTNVKTLPFNSKKYSISNPCLSPDGKTLYFSSDMPGSFGGVDIWKVTVNANGTYGRPVNLGEKINTKGNESFPFIADDNKLYFASDGHLGFGGLDVYSVDENMKVTNLGRPINSGKDDFAFNFNPTKNIGFLSSNRKGSDNMYKVVPPTAENITLLATEEMIEDEKLRETIFKAFDTGNEEVVKKELAVTIARITENAPLAPKIKDISVTADETEMVNPRTVTDEYIEKENIKSENKNNVYALPVNKNEIITADENDDIAIGEQFGEIRFGFDKTFIMGEAAEELDRLVQAMKDNPKMEVLVKSHTDTRGSKAYNLQLSEQRAQATVEYVISKGISRDRISGKGYGEDSLKISCSAGCTPQQHMQNRRSELIIVKK